MSRLELEIDFHSTYHQMQVKILVQAKARRAKIEKYQGLAEALRTRFSTVEVDVIVVGSLGSWYPANDRTMKKLCSVKYLSLFRNLCVSNVV